MSPDAVEVFASWMEREAQQRPSAPMFGDRLVSGAALVRSMHARIEELENAVGSAHEALRDESMAHGLSDNLDEIMDVLREALPPGSEP